MAAHALGEKLLPAVAVFGHGRVGVFFLERRDASEVGLLVGVVNARRGGIEKALGTPCAGARCSMWVLMSTREHAERLVVLDEAHAAHVGGEIIDFVRALGRCLAVFAQIQVERKIFDIIKALVPLFERLDIHGANALVSLAAQVRHQMPADKSSCAGNHHSIVTSQITHPCLLHAHLRLRKNHSRNRGTPLSPKFDYRCFGVTGARQASRRSVLSPHRLSRSNPATRDFPRGSMHHLYPYEQFKLCYAIRHNSYGLSGGPRYDSWESTREFVASYAPPTLRNCGGVFGLPVPGPRLDAQRGL